MPEQQRHALPKPGTQAVYHTADGAPYVLCRSTESFCNPTKDNSLSCEDVNATLNLNLGQSVITRQNIVGRIFRFLYRFLDVLLVQWWEPIGMYMYTELVPIQLKRFLTQRGWNLYVRLHARLFYKSTGLHPSQSAEYHALTTAMFQSKFLAWTPRRMRFFLSELRTSSVQDPPDMERVDIIQQEMSSVLPDSIPKKQANHTTVRGWYIRQTESNNNTNGVLFWIYGGAYLSGDARGNASAADAMCQRTGCSAVFVPEFRLAPEADLFEVLWDLCLALHWLQQQERASSSQQPIYCVGVSSGAALVMRLLQLMAAHQTKQPKHVPAYLDTLVAQLDLSTIEGAVLFAPYVDYEQLYPHERHGSFQQYAIHDLVVNEAVQEYGLPYLKKFIPTGCLPETTGDQEKDSRAARRQQSPIHIPCKGMPPLCVISSEHECVHDQTVELVNKARKEGVEVTLGVWKYMCHVFSLLNMMIPEGQLSMDVAVAWVKERQQQVWRKQDQETWKHQHS